MVQNRWNTYCGDPCLLALLKGCCTLSFNNWSDYRDADSIWCSLFIGDVIEVLEDVVISNTEHSDDVQQGLMSEHV
jgi:hypothetical protein